MRFRERRRCSCSTAYNPNGIAREHARNKAAQEALEAEVQRTERTAGRPPGDHAMRPGWSRVFAVAGFDRATACDLGRRYGQLAVFELTDDEFTSCVAADDQIVEGTAATRVVGPNAADASDAPGLSLPSAAVDVDRQIELLTAGAVDVISEGGAAQRSSRRAGRCGSSSASTRPPPTSTSASRWCSAGCGSFQDLGHVAVLIIGDFTAMVGDPSGKSVDPARASARHEVDAHAQTYIEQATRILDPSPERLEIVAQLRVARARSTWTPCSDDRRR